MFGSFKAEQSYENQVKFGKEVNIVYRGQEGGIAVLFIRR